MKIPKEIEMAIYQCADANDVARMNEIEIIKWLDKNKLTEESLVKDMAERCELTYDVMRNMDDTFIDCCQLGNNPEEFIKILKNI